MGFQQEVFALIARLGASENKIALDRTFCQFMGSLEGGVFLSQLLHWSDKGSDPEWFYKSYKEWHQETFLSEYQVRRCAKTCEEMGFLAMKLRRANGSPTLHYHVDQAKFLDSILKFLRIETAKFKNPNETISESILEKPQKQLTKKTTETHANSKKRPPRAHKKSYDPSAYDDL